MQRERHKQQRNAKQRNDAYFPQRAAWGLCIRTGDLKSLLHPLPFPLTHTQTAFIISKSLSCYLVYQIASLIAAGTTKYISTHFYKSTHFKKLKVALEKEFQLQVRQILVLAPGSVAGSCFAFAMAAMLLLLAVKRGAKQGAGSREGRY